MLHFSLLQSYGFIRFLSDFRVGVASFITLLVQKVMIDIKPFTALLLKLLYSAVLEERSSAVKRAFASSCATVLKYASPSQAQKLIEDTTSLHFGGKNDQLSGAILIKAYLSNASDIIFKSCFLCSLFMFYLLSNVSDASLIYFS